MRSRGRLAAAFLRPSRTQMVVGALLAALGFAAVTQVRTADNDASFTGYREQDLIDVLNGLAGATQRSQAEIARLEAARDDLRNSTSKQQAALDEARGEVATLSILAGTVPVSGPGIRVTIAQRTDTDTVDSFLDLIEELRSVGAEAIQINGNVRLVAQSSFDRSARGLVVDGHTLTPPYIVEAIGEPSTLAAAVTFPRGPESEFEADGATVNVVQLTTLDLTAVVGQ